MSNKESLKSWGLILALLVLTALVTAVWPLITNQLGTPSTRTKPEVQIIEINLPGEINGVSSVSLTGMQAIGVLTGVVVVAVIAAGIPLAFAYTFLSRQVTTLTESDEFKTQSAALDKQGKEQLKQLSSDRTVAPIPEHKMPRWSVVSTSLIILLFVIFGGMVIAGTFGRDGEYELLGQLVNSAVPVVGGFVLITLVLLIWRMRSHRLDAIADTDNGPIPWDFIWVLLLGLLVVGLGVGLMVYLNAPV